MSSFETDVMEDLYYDEAEGPARQHFDEYDEFAEEEGDEFLRNIIGGLGRAVGGLIGGGGDGFDEYDEFDEYDAYDVDEYEDMEALDAMEEAVVDALEAEDTDEFFRRLRRGLGRVARIARGAVRTVGRGIRAAAPIVGQIARTVGPIASLIPHPAAQAVGRLASVAGRVLPADEFDTMEDLFDFAEDEDAIDAAAPVIAGLTIRRTMPGVSRLPRPARRQLVRSVTRATRAVARRQGPQAARAVPGVVRTVQSAVRQGRIPPRAAPQAIQRAATRVARSPQATRQMTTRAGMAAARSAGAVGRRRGTCPSCSRGGRNFRLRGPVTISIQGR
ncbi:MAG: hypothetical protein PHD43_10945 [Methylococcales bacterium]|nr:hypothetical protein [Methylococcales bacterium]